MMNNQSGRRHRRRWLGLVCLSMLVLAVGGRAARALLIVPTYDSSITSNANAAAIQAAIGTAINTVDGLYSDAGTVGIYFKFNASVLGSTSTVRYVTTTADYVAALQADATANPNNTVLATAVAHINSVPASLVAGTSALFRVALGANSVTPCFSATGGFLPGCNGVNDAVITIGTTDTGSPGAGLNSKAVAVIEHELNEVLGGGGPGTMLTAATSLPASVLGSTAIGVTDFYRYLSATGNCAGITSTLSTSNLANVVACYSIDGGVTALAQMNQNTNGSDYGDFAFTGTNNIQNANYSGATPLYSTLSPEFTMLLSIGWDPIPEPAVLGLFLVGLAGLAGVRWHESRSQIKSARV